MNARRALVFPPFALDLDEDRLWRDGEEISLKPKARSMLRYLATHPRRLVSKAELASAVWPDSHVSSATIRSTLREVRAALDLGDGGEEIIETARGRGYRFVANLGTDEPRQPASPPRPRILFGRAEARRTLRRWLQAADGGRRRIGFVVGAPGIGKTSLVEEFRQEVEERELLCGYGQCISRYGDREPYRPLLEALGRLCRGPGGRRVVDHLRRDAPSWLLELPGLLDPAERRQLTRASIRVNQDRMLQELAEALEIICADDPAVLILEDLHWSDSATLGAIELVARRTEPARLLIVGTHRPIPSTYPDGQPTNLGTVRVELDLHDLCDEHTLSSLSATDVRAYVDDRLPGVDAPDEVASHVFRWSEGNPLVMASYCDEMIRQGAIEPAGDGWRMARDLETVAMPSGVRRMLEHQIDQLPRSEQRALEAASVAGVEFRVEALAAALAPEAPGLDEELARAHRNGSLLTSLPQDRLRFRHALYRELLYERLPFARRKVLHLLLGDALERARTEDTDTSAELSMHFERGGDLGRAVRYAIEAADAAIRRSAHAEAAEILRRAHELAAGSSDSTERRHWAVEIPTKLGNCLSITLGYTASEVHEAFRLARAHLGDLDGDDPGAISVLSGLCGFYSLRSEHRAAYEVADQQLAIAQRRADPYDRLIAAISVSSVASSLGRSREALDSIELALRDYDPEQDPPDDRPLVNDIGVHALAQSGLALATVGRADEALGRIDDAIERARRLDHGPSEVLAHFYGMLVTHGLGDHDGATRAAARTLELSFENGFPFYIPGAMIISGSTQVRTGDAESGLSSIEQGIALMDAAGARLAMPLYLALLAEACGGNGDVENGLRHVANGLEAVEETGEVTGSPELWCARGELLARSEGVDSAAAEDSFRRGVDAARATGAPTSGLRPVLRLADIWIARGDRDRARTLLEEVPASLRNALRAPLGADVAEKLESLGS